MATKDEQPMMVGEVRRLALRPGDQVIYQTDRLVSSHELNGYVVQCMAGFPDHDVLVVSGGQLLVVSDPGVASDGVLREGMVEGGQYWRPWVCSMIWIRCGSVVATWRWW